ncbi:WD40-repeat-containing domain protein [Lentinula raphanica]|nr:WD40-repeat-containing domain protein [Lentinula raphanica]
MYQRLATLQGARDAVISLSFSPQAKFIAAAGYGGVAVWTLNSFNAIPIPSNIYNPRNPDYVCSACAWLHFEQADRHVLLVGSQEGTLSILQCDEKDMAFHPSVKVLPEHAGFQILSIDVYQAEIAIGKLARIVVATADNRITAYSLSSSGDLREIFSVALVEFSLIAAKFCKKTADVYAFELNGGTILKLDNKTGDIKSNQKYGPDPIGTVCTDESSNFFVACTGQDFQMFRLDTIEHVKTFSGPEPVIRFPKVATFAEDGAILVGGTDSGHAVIFDVTNGSQIQELNYPKGGLVQPVAACTSQEGFLIAIAGSTIENPAEVVIYRRDHLRSTAKRKEGPPVNIYHTFLNRGSLLQQFVVIVGILLMMNGLRSLFLPYIPRVGIPFFFRRLL